MPSSSDRGEKGHAPLEVAAMSSSDLEEVLAIERISYPTPWSRESFLFELRENPYAWNVVARREGRLVGYACLWCVDEELKINNIAVHPGERGAGLGRELLGWVLREAVARGCTRATLEVRPSNRVALSLYGAYGFREVARRPSYYQDTREDAIVMALDLAPPAPR